MISLKLYENFQNYYKVDGKILYNKTRAIELAGGDLSKVSYNWNPEIWDAVPWSIEPQETWQELVKQRCLQLRNLHNHIALWYSSGYDSHTILHGFTDNNILLDEIVIEDRRQLYDDPEPNVAIEHANYIKNKYYPNLKITVIEFEGLEILKYYKNKGVNWIYDDAVNTRFTKTNKYMNLHYYDYFKRNLADYDKRCDILGHDKPKVYLHDNKWFTFTTDIHMIESLGFKNASFYISDDFTKIHLKQVHNAINWFESLPEFYPDLVHEIQGRDIKNDSNYIKYYAEWNKAIGRYPLPHSHIYSKSGMIKMYHTDNKLSPDGKKLMEYAEKHDHKAYKIYNDGLSEILRINREKDNTVNVNPTFLSKAYYIRDFKRKY